MKKKSIVSKLFLLLSFVLLGICLGACGNGKNSASPSGTKTIKFFNGNIELSDWYKKTIDEYNQSQDKIKVEYEFQKEGTNALQLKFASGDIPDISNVSNQGLVDEGKFIDLTNEDKWWDRMDDSVKEKSKDFKSGKIYGVPAVQSIAGVFYNKSIIEKMNLPEPKNFDEFTENLIKIKNSSEDITPLYIGGKDGWMAGMMINWFPEAVQKQKLGDDGYKDAARQNDLSKLQFGTPDGYIAKFGDALIDFKDKGLINEDVVTASYDDQQSQFAGGKVAYIVQGVWALSGIQDNNPDFEIGFMPFPTMDSNLDSPVFISNDTTYFITSDSKNQDASKEFLDYLFSKEIASDYSKTRNAPSSFNDVDVEWSPYASEIETVLSSSPKIDWTPEPVGYNADETGRIVQELLVNQLKDGNAFSKALKELWVKSFESTNNQ